MNIATVDADTHVIESESTWERWQDLGLSGEPPIVCTADNHEGPSWQNQWWLFDGNVLPKQAFPPEATLTAEGARELSDIDRRIVDMDGLDVAAQVVFSTYFISRATMDPRREASLCRCYNSWVATATGRSNGRLRWTAVLPLLDAAAAVKELEQATSDGACGVHVRGFEGDSMLTDERFFPIYEAAMALDTPICIHAGNGSMHLDRTLFPRKPELSYARNKVPVIAAFSAIAASDLHRRFPQLRFGFIEAGASWLPALMADLRTRGGRGRGTPVDDYAQFLKEKRLYVACQLDDDLEYLVEQVGDECLVIGSDYGHADNASDLSAVKRLASQTQLSSSARENIISSNPNALYRSA